MGRSSTILTCIGAAGVVLTAILTAKASPKAVQILKEAEEEKGEKLSKWEAVKEAAPVYVPAIVSGALTIACIFSANILNKRQQAALTSAYALLDNYHKEFVKKTNELYGEDAEKRVREEVVKGQYKQLVDEMEDDEVLFFDYHSLGYFRARMGDVLEKVTMEDGMECYIISSPYDNDYLNDPWRF